MDKKTHSTDVIPGHALVIGQGFQALQVAEQHFGGLIDPVVMMDHFHMTAPTFEPHPHAGMSAVTYVFEDSVGHHMNYDSIGNHGPIRPGDLHWMVAGRGVVHTEQPEGQGLHIHALQIFVNLPAAKKFIEPHAVHVDAADMPEFRAPGVRVRVVAGDTHGLSSPAALPEPFTLLDGFLDADTSFDYVLNADWNALVYVVKGSIALSIGAESKMLAAGQAVGIGRAPATLSLAAQGEAHFVILSGRALKEPVVKHGPFVMNTPEQIDDRIAAYRRGDFGSIPALQGN